MASHSENNKLGKFLTEVSNWNWEEFCLAENDPKYTSNESIIFALVRACAMEKMEAIKMALNRVDGKLKTPVRIEAPRVFMIFPRAKLPDTITDEEVEKFNKRQQELKHLGPGTFEITKGDTPIDEEAVEEDLKDLSLRQTLAKMSDYPREVPKMIIEYATQVQRWMNGHDIEPVEKPRVKSVITAHLLQMAQTRDVTALAEVLDQIDGKLVETIQLLGEDISIVSYATIAPDNAYVNKDGIMEVEAINAQNLWAEKLGGIL